MFLYRHDPTQTDIVASPNLKIGLPDIPNSCSSVLQFDENLGLSPYIFEPRLVNGTQIPYPGFPSLGVLPMQQVLVEPIGLNCFGSASKYATMTMTMNKMPPLPPTDELAERVLGQPVYVNWPMMHEARIAAVSDGQDEYRLEKGKLKRKTLTEAAKSRWLAETEAMAQGYYRGTGVPGSGGVNVGDIKVRLSVHPLQGMRTIPGTGAKKKCYGREEADIPLQLGLWQAPAPDPRLVERGPTTLEDRFPVGSSVVLTKGKHRGCIGTVLGFVDDKHVGVKVQMMPSEAQFGLTIAKSVQELYMSSTDASRILKLHPALIGKVMGKLQFEEGHFDLGLNLKSSDGSCVVGFTRKKQEHKQQSRKQKKDAWSTCDSVLVVGSRMESIDNVQDENDTHIQWEYSPKAIQAVQDYQRKFPSLFAGLKKLPNERKYKASVVLGARGAEMLSTIREWYVAPYCTLY